MAFSSRLLSIIVIGSLLMSPTLPAQQSMQTAFDSLQKQVASAASAGDYPSLEALTRAQIALVPQSADAHYNLACALAMQGKTNEAMQSLVKSAAFGFANANLLQKDDDLASLRGEAAFAATMAIVDLNQRAVEQTATPAAPGGVPPLPLVPPPPRLPSAANPPSTAPTAPPLPLALPMPANIPPAAAGGGSKVGRKVQGLWRGQWWPATVTAEQDGQCYVHYDNGTSGTDEWVPMERLKNKDGSAIQGDANVVVPAVEPRIPATPAPTPAAVAPAAGGGGLDWVYIETKVLPPNLGGTTFMGYRLMPNGIVTRGGVQMDKSANPSFDYAASAASDPHYVGHYARQGGEIVLTFEGGTVRKFKIQDASPAPKLLPLVRAGKLPQGHGLSGKYHTQKGHMGTSLGAMLTAAIRFEPDGTFALTKRATSVAGSTGGAFSQSTEGGQEVTGTYSVQDWVLTYTLGSESTRVIAYTYDIDSTGPTPSVIGFTGYTFNRSTK